MTIVTRASASTAAGANAGGEQAWDLLQNPPEFSLVLGGPLYQLLRRTHLSDDALTMVRRRVIVIALLTWLPLLILSALEGNLTGGDRSVPPFCTTWKRTSASCWRCRC